MPFSPFLNTISPGMILISMGLGLVALCLFNLLITLVEGVVLTLLKWKSFRGSLVASLLMNAISSLLAAILLIFLQNTPVAWLIITFILSVIIEGLALVRIQPSSRWKSWFFSLAANLASYLILILPAYIISLNR
jgi:peptidoglycan/LPS O-acetylase OafA/YrhL